MISFREEYPEEFNRIMNILTDEVYSFFMEIGSNLDFEDIYATVFPEHKQEDKISAMQDLKTLHNYIRDSFSHNLSPLYEYVLYNVLNFVHDTSEDGFNLADSISTQLTKDIVGKLNEDTLKLLRNIQTPYDLIDIIFEDIDFLDVGKLFDIYRNHPEIVTEFLHVDLDDYEDLMPEDIKAEYKAIKNSIASQQLGKVEVNDSIEFKEAVIKMVQNFKYHVEQKKGFALLNTLDGNVNEKKVQILS